jgi:hypothetical protein
MAPRILRAVGAAAAALGAGLLSGCAAATYAPPGPDAALPVCGEVVAYAPPEVLDLARTEPASQGTAVWGRGDEAVVLRCGVTPPPPDPEGCTRLEDDQGNLTDWLIRPTDDGGWMFTTYGREPAIDVLVPSGVGGDQPSAALLALSSTVQRIEPTTHCVGLEDTAGR